MSMTGSPKGMLRSKLVQPTWPYLDVTIRWCRRQALLWTPYALCWLPVTVRFFLLVLVEAMYNLYLFCFRPAAQYRMAIARIMEEGRDGGVAIVTGGTSGIGKEIVRSLVQAGYHVHLRMV